MLESFVGVRYLLDRRRSYALRLSFVIGINLLVHGLGLTFLVTDASQLTQLIGLILLVLGMLTTYITSLALFLSVYTVISVVGVTVGVAALTTVLSVMSGFELDLRRKILGANAHIVLRKEGDGDMGDLQALLSRARNTPDVLGASPFIDDEVIATSPTGLSGVTLKGIDPSSIGQVSSLPSNIPKDQGSLDLLVHPERILQEYPLFRVEPSSSLLQVTDEDEDTLQRKPGEVIQTLEPPPSLPPSIPPSIPARKLPGVILGKQLAEETLHVSVGDEINLVTPWGDLGPTGPIPKSRAFRVAGIFYSGMFEFDARYVYLTLSEAQKFLLLDGTVTGIEVKVNHVENADKTAETLENNIRDVSGGPYEAVTWQELNKSLFSALKVEKRMMFLVLVVIILVAAFFIVSSLLMVVVQKGREIAVLKSMGATGDMIRRIFLAAGSFIGVTGTMFGLLGGYGLCRLIAWRGIPIPADVYYISSLPVVIQAAEFFSVGAAALFISLLATLYPSSLASRMTPVEGLRL